ncbi:MAG: hypothetical protein V1659_00740 [Candidatus Woesearchaeota archaeon]
MGIFKKGDKKKAHSKAEKTLKEEKKETEQASPMPEHKAETSDEQEEFIFEQNSKLEIPEPRPVQAAAKPNINFEKKEEILSIKQDLIKPDFAEKPREECEPRGFFLSLNQILDNPDRLKSLKELLSHEELVKEMKKFHSNEKISLNALNKNGLKQEIAEKLGELNSLEKKWAVSHRECKKYQTELELLEREIKIHAEILNSLLKQLNKNYPESIISPEQYFYTADGQAYRSMAELAEGLLHMADEIFSVHVSQYKNDFANWIAHVFDNNELADILRSLKTREEMIRMLKNV